MAAKMADAPALDLDISVEAEQWGAVATVSTVAERAARAAFAAANGKGPAEAAIVLSTDARVQLLNRDYRGQDKPTNVLSFASGDDAMEMPDGVPHLLGDIIVAYETTAREAAAENKSISDHFSHLVVHGMLHLLGYDHQDDAQAQEMEDLEVQVLADLGIDDPYGA